MNVQYTIYFKDGGMVQGTLERHPDRDCLGEMYKIAIEKTIELKKPPEHLAWRLVPR